MISGGEAHSIVCDSGHVYTMGTNEYGQIGLPRDTIMKTTPTELDGLSNVERIACGGRCSFAVKDNGEAHAWGIGSNYQLGCDLDEDDIFTPTQMQGKKLDNAHVCGVSCGGQHTALLVAMDTNN